MPATLPPTIDLSDLANLLSTCRSAIAEQWDEDHEETIALVDRIADVLSAQLNPIKVWTGAIDCKYGGTQLYAAPNEAALYAQMAVFCTEYWQETGDDKAPDPNLSPREIVEHYFQVQSERGDEWHVVEEVVFASGG